MDHAHALTASFKFLHVTGSAKSKNFQPSCLLTNDIAEPSPNGLDGGGVTGNERVWASFDSDSAPIIIISVPSQEDREDSQHLLR